MSFINTSLCVPSWPVLLVGSGVCEQPSELSVLESIRDPSEPCVSGHPRRARGGDSARPPSAQSSPRRAGKRARAPCPARPRAPMRSRGARARTASNPSALPRGRSGARRRAMPEASGGTRLRAPPESRRRGGSGASGCRGARALPPRASAPARRKRSGALEPAGRVSPAVLAIAPVVAGADVVPPRPSSGRKRGAEQPATAHGSP